MKQEIPRFTVQWDGQLGMSEGGNSLQTANNVVKRTLDELREYYVCLHQGQNLERNQ